MDNLNLCIDIGNTLLKAALFEKNRLVEKEVFNTEDVLLEWVTSRHWQHAILCTVRASEEKIVPLLRERGYFSVFNSSLKLPIQNRYATPETLGVDRLASVVGAHALYPDKDCLVVDAGTCVTYDLVTCAGSYLGGSISPGLQMRFKALHHFTAKLPLLDAHGEAGLLGNDTSSCIRSGVVNGLLFELEKIIAQYRQTYPDLQVLFCGGDAPFFESRIKETIFVHPDLVLVGLNHTLIHNAPL